MTKSEIYRAIKRYGQFTRKGAHFVHSRYPFAFETGELLPLIVHKLLTYKNGKLRINRDKSDGWISRKLEELDNA